MMKRGLFLGMCLVLAAGLVGVVYAGGAKEGAGASAASSGGAFSMTKFKGQSVRLLLNKHGYTDSMLQELPNFEKLTGIKVTYDIYPEEQYFDKVTVALSSGSSDYDVYMTGAYQVWQYAPPGWVEPLEKYINDPNVTNPDYDASDLLPNMMASLRWDLKDGDKPGTGHQWALPWGFEENTLMYNKKIFADLGLTPPKTFAEVIKIGKLIEDKYPGVVGIAVRGSRNWATIHPGFLTGFASAGGSDYDNNMNPTMNSPLGVKYAKAWADMIKQVGPSQWTTYTWYDVGNALGAGKAAMIFDADILGFFQNVPGGSKESGNIAWAVGPGLDGPATKANVWIWSLSMNAASKKKVPAWYWLQWATGKDFLTTAAVKYTLVDPVRQSVWNNPAFQKRLESFTGYLDTFKALSADARVYFTAQSHFQETTTEWAAALQEIYGGADAQATLDKLAASLKK